MATSVFGHRLTSDRQRNNGLQQVARRSLGLVTSLAVSMVPILPARASLPAGALPTSSPRAPLSLSCNSSAFGDFVPDRAAFGTTDQSKKKYSVDTEWVATAPDGTTATLRTVQINNNSGDFVSTGADPDVFFLGFVDPNTGFSSPKLTEREGTPGDSWVLELEYSRPIGNARLLLGDVDSEQPTATIKFKDVVTVEGFLDAIAVDSSQQYVGSLLQTSVTGTAYTFQDIPPLGRNPSDRATRNRVAVDYENRFVDRVQITYAVGESLTGVATQAGFMAAGMAAGCQISGTTFEDQTANDALDSTENGLTGVAVTLYKDDGDTVFEPNGDDLLIETQDTGSSGAYLFTNLAENSTYWVDVDTTDADLGGRAYGGGDVDVTQTVPRAVALETSNVENINFPFDKMLGANIALVKRITAINRGLANEQLFDSDYVDVGTTDDDNDPAWPSRYLSGVVNGGTIQPGDTIEYTIYFLSNGGATAQDFRLCDRIPDYLTFVDDAFDSDTGILVGSTGGDNPLTNADDGDIGTYVSSNNDSLARCGWDLSGGAQDRGFVVVAVGDVPSASSNAPGAYGFMRFHAQVQ